MKKVCDLLIFSVHMTELHKMQVQSCEKRRSSYRWQKWIYMVCVTLKEIVEDEIAITQLLIVLTDQILSYVL